MKTYTVIGKDEEGYDLCKWEDLTKKEAMSKVRSTLKDTEYLQAGLYRVEIWKEPQVGDMCDFDYYVKDSHEIRQ